MNKVFDKLKPVFEAIAANKYISAIRDGFIACMPIIIFSSIFMMVAYVPNAWVLLARQRNEYVDGCL